MSSEDNQCAICWSSFCNPKLLPCRHTFCKKCIKVHGKRQGEFFNCPLCRATVAVPEKGVSGFLNNYFADDTFPESVCDECWVEEKIEDCRTCEKSFCIYCKSSHNCKERSLGTRRRLPVNLGLLDDDMHLLQDDLSDQSSDADTLSDSEREDGSRTLPSEFKKYGTMTLCNIKLLKTIRDNSDNIGSVTGLFNISKDKIGASYFGWDILEQYNMAGVLTGQIPLQSSESCGNDGIFFINEGDGHIKKMTDMGESHVVIKADFRPLKLTAFLDGRVVVVGQKTKQTKHSLAVYVYDKNFKLGTSFKLPHQACPQFLAVNTAYDYICASFLEGNCIQIFDMCGNVVGTYRGRPSEDTDERQFRPVGICCNREGNIIVVDGRINILHLLSSSGSFKGIIQTGLRDLGHPFSITVDSRDRIWIGDSENMTIRIFQIDSYENVFWKSNERNPEVCGVHEAPSTVELDFLRFRSRNQNVRVSINHEVFSTSDMDFITRQRRLLDL